MFLKPICFIENGHGNKVQSQLLCNRCVILLLLMIRTFAKANTKINGDRCFLKGLVENVPKEYTSKALN